jgi:hypothetical protein
VMAAVAVLTVAVRGVFGRKAV